MTPYYQDEWSTIYNCDCREVLPTLEPVDCIISDVPYGISYKTAWRSSHDKLRVDIANDRNLGCFGLAWEPMYKLLRPDRHWYIFASPKQLAEMSAICKGYKHILVWDKGDRGTVGDLTCGFGEAWEAIFYGMKGRRHLNGKRPRTVIRYDWSGTQDPRHPTVKPVGLLKKLVLWSTNEGETVLDPFAGSGTTLRAAKDLGRKSIGIEISERYCEIAAKRLAQNVFDFEVTR